MKSMEKNEKQSGRMRSIVYQLQIRWLFRRIGSYIRWDILLFLGAGFGWIVKKEMEILGYFLLSGHTEDNFRYSDKYEIYKLGKL